MSEATKNLKIRLIYESAEAEARDRGFHAGLQARARETASAVARANKETHDAAAPDQQEKLRQQVKRWEETTAAITGAGKQVLMFGAGMVGLNSVTSVLSDIAQKFNAIRMAGIKAASDILDEAEKLRPYAAMVGQNMGQPSQLLMQQLAFRTATLQTEQEARTMSTEAYASGNSAIQAKLISAQEFDKHLATAGKLQVMTGAAEAAVGKVSGILPSVTGKQVNKAEDLDVMLERLYELQKLGGFRDYGQAATQFAGSAEYVMKGVYSAPRAQALLSAFALAGQGDTASERLSQVTTSVSAGLIKNRGMKVNPDYQADVEKSGEYFKRLGVTGENKPEERIMAVVNDLLGQEDKTKAAGKNWDPMLYLYEKGFINVQARESLAKLAGAERTGGQLGNLMALADKPMTGTPLIDRDFENYRKYEPSGSVRESRTQAQLREYKEGQEKFFQEEMMRRAFGQLGGETQFGGDLKSVQDGWSPVSIYQRSQLMLEAQHMIFKEADKYGVKHTDAMMPGHLYGQREEFLGFKQLQDISEETRKAGGGITPGFDPRETNNILKDIKALLERNAPGPPASQRAGAPPPNLGPAMPPHRAANAGGP